MSKRLENKVALIIGGNAGIGEAISKHYIKEGARVVISGRSEANSDRVKALMNEIGDQAMYVSADISKSEDIEKLVNETVTKFGRLDIAVNNAGVSSNPGPFIDQTEEEFDRVVDINLKGVFLAMKYEIAQMLKNGGGAIINTTSVGGVIGNYNIAPYIASKHGVIGLTKAAALEYARQGIRVNAVAPGGVETKMLTTWLPGDALKAMAEHHPMGRNSQPEEQSGLFVFLGSDESSFITGSTYFNDGGYTAQ